MTVATGRARGGDPDSAGPAAACRILLFDAAAGGVEQQRLDLAERWLAVHACAGEAAAVVQYRLGVDGTVGGGGYLVNGEPCGAVAVAAAIAEQIGHAVDTPPTGLALLAAVPTDGDLQILAGVLRCPVTAPDQAIWGHRGGVVAAEASITAEGAIRLGTPGRWLLGVPASPPPGATTAGTPAQPVALADERWTDLLAGVEPGARDAARRLSEPDTGIAPNRPSTADERIVLRIWQGFHHELAVRAVMTKRADNPRAGSKMDEAEATDLAAVRLFLESWAPEDARDPGVTWPESGRAALAHAACLVSGLNRLPTFQGPVRTAVDAALTAAFTAEQAVRVRRPLVTTALAGAPRRAAPALAGPPQLPTAAPATGTASDPAENSTDGPSSGPTADQAELVIWSINGRRADDLFDEHAESTVVFPPGAMFRVLAVEQSEDGGRLLLSEVLERQPVQREPEHGSDDRTLDKLRAALASQRQDRDGRSGVYGTSWH